MVNERVALTQLINAHLEHEEVSREEFAAFVSEFVCSAPSGYLPKQFAEEMQDWLSGRSMEGQCVGKD